MSCTMRTRRLQTKVITLQHNSFPSLGGSLLTYPNVWHLRFSSSCPLLQHVQPPLIAVLQVSVSLREFSPFQRLSPASFCFPFSSRDTPCQLCDTAPFCSLEFLSSLFVLRRQVYQEKVVFVQHSANFAGYFVDSLEEKIEDLRLDDCTKRQQTKLSDSWQNSTNNPFYHHSPLDHQIS